MHLVSLLAAPISARVEDARYRRTKTTSLDERTMPLLDPAQRKSEQGAPAPKERKKRVRTAKPSAAEATDEDLAGPVVRAFPIPKK